MGVVVRQKEKGRGKPWWVFISHNNKRKSVKVGDKAAAEKVASDIRAELKRGTLDLESKKERSIPTFKLYANAFMDTYSKLNHKPSTRESYENVLDLHLYPVFEDKRLDKITRKEIKDFVIKKQTSGLSANTVRIILSYLSAILNEAVDDELLTGNPAVRVRKAIAKDDKKEINPLTAGELDHLLNTVQQHYPKHYALFLLLARTGMRIGEALALRWADIDFNGRFIEVRRSVVRGRVSTPKSGKSRCVDMSPQLAETLNIHLTESKKRGLSLGIGEPEIVFMNRKGGLIDVNNWRRRVFNKALTKAKMRRIRIHDLRHTYATLRLQAGHNIVDVSNQLGHHSVKLTLDVYSHWMPGQNKGQVDALDSLHLSAPYTHSDTNDKEKRTRKSV